MAVCLGGMGVGRGCHLVFDEPGVLFLSFPVDKICLFMNEVKLHFSLGLWKDLSRTWCVMKTNFRVIVTKSLQAGTSASQIQMQLG